MKPEFLIRFAFLAAFLFLIDIYAFQAVKTLIVHNNYKKWLQIAYWSCSFALLIWLFYGIATFKRSAMPAQASMLSAVLMMVYLAKLFVLFVLFGEDIFRVFAGIFNEITGRNRATNTDVFLPARRHFVSQIALGIGGLMMGVVGYGVTKGKYNYKVVRRTLFFDDLPQNFDGFTITQLSDIHSGSFDDEVAVQQGIDLANAQGSDVLLFTGDIVNNVAEEIEHWQQHFAQLTAPMGVFSILGNHDYGDYTEWESKEAKAQNLQKLKDIHGKMGFDLLLNEHRTLRKGDQKITLAGVENWGKPPFPQYGDLNQALQGSAHNFIVLMSHDPSHWRAKVLDYAQKIHLTLSGHTHGMQFGIEIPGWFKFSPVKWKYPEWADLYTEKGRNLYVNRGFGFLGFPGRVGIMPEITVITLKKTVLPA